MDNQEEDDELDDPECCPVEDLAAVVFPFDFLVVRVIASSPEVVTSLHSLVLSIIVKRD